MALKNHSVNFIKITCTICLNVNSVIESIINKELQPHVIRLVVVKRQEVPPVDGLTKNMQLIAYLEI